MTDLRPAMADNYEQARGLFCKSVTGVRFDGVQIRTPDTPVMRFEASGSVSLHRLDVNGGSDGPVVSISNVEQMGISACGPSEIGERPFLSADGDGALTVSLAGYHAGLRDAIETGSDGPRIEQS